MSNAGRKKWVPPDLVKVETFAERGLTYKQIALVLGIDEKTLRVHRRANEAFQAALDKGRARGIAAVANVVYDLAIVDRDPATCRFIMRAVGGWDDSRKVEVSGPAGGPVPIDVRGKVDVMAEVRKFARVLATDGAETDARDEADAAGATRLEGDDA